MGRGKNIGKILAMLVLIIILVLGGMLWFDYLGVINAKTLFAPVYRLLGLQLQTSGSTEGDLTLTANLEDDRFDKRLESLESRSQELDTREENILVVEAENFQIAEQLEETRIALVEREKTFNNRVKMYDDRSVNIEQTARYLNAMPPVNAVEILNAMEDQEVIDALRKVDEIAVASGAASQTSNWLSMMPADRVAELTRKMTSKPTSID